jgi:hypothetical protein
MYQGMALAMPLKSTEIAGFSPCERLADARKFIDATRPDME